MDYETNVSSFEKKGAIFGHETRKGLEKNTKIPGPGTYDLTPLEKSKYHIVSVNKDSRKTFDDNSSNLPGPGQYYVDERKKDGFTY